MQANSDIIALDPGRHIKVYDWLNAERIAEGNVATLQAVLGPFKVDIAFGDVHPAHNGRPGRSSAHVQIKIAGELGQRGFHAQLRRGGDVQIKAHIVEEWIQRGDDGRFLALGQVVGKVKMRIHAEAGHHNVAAQQGASG